MTPSEVIEQVKRRFDVLYYSDPVDLDAMMADSLGAYEDKAGSLKSLSIADPDTSIEKPTDCLSVVATSDGCGRYIDFDDSGENITISGLVAYPVKVQYLVKFRGYDVNTKLPAGSIGPITEHFAANLALRNTRRERNVVLAAGLQRELPSDETLQARIDAVELSMEEARAIIPMITVV